MLACPHPDAGPPGSQHTPNQAQLKIMSPGILLYFSPALMALLFFCPWIKASHPTSADNFVFTSLHPFDFILKLPSFHHYSFTILCNYFVFLTTSLTISSTSVYTSVYTLSVYPSMSLIVFVCFFPVWLGHCWSVTFTKCI